jgi:hypothetical protein
MPSFDKRTIHGDDRVCVEVRGERRKLDYEHWYEHVPELIETGHESEVNILQINKCQPIELSVTKYRTS